MPDFLKVDYLRTGNPRQRLAYDEIQQLHIMDHLEKYTPTLAGTVPIEIDIEGKSDLDIICCVHETDFDDFETLVTKYYSSQKGFQIHQRQLKNQQKQPPYVLAVFQAQHFEIEIFGQSLPVVEQNAYRHMMIEYHLLQGKGKDFRQEIIHLKQSGIKTEPAFAKALGLKGDNPYDELLKIELNC